MAAGGENRWPYLGRNRWPLTGATEPGFSPPNGEESRFCRIVMTDLLPRPPELERVLLVNGVSVALGETTREVRERQGLPAGGLRERSEQ